jgi:hypothetical protein
MVRQEGPLSDPRILNSVPLFETMVVLSCLSFSIYAFFHQVSASKMAAGAGYAENLRKLATFRTLEEFWGVYTHLLRADELPKDSNYHVFREGILSDLCFSSHLRNHPCSGYLPMWESFPFGGCWIIRVRSHSPRLPLLDISCMLLLGIVGN